MGLASRKFPDIFPDAFVAHAGDALWTIAAYLTLALFFPTWPPLRLGFAALTTSFAVEFSQLLDLGFLNGIRSTTPGKLVLGEGFVQADLARYLVGAAIVTAIDLLWTTVSRKYHLAKTDHQSID